MGDIGLAGVPVGIAIRGSIYGCSRCLLRCSELGASFEEGLEDSIWSLEVIVYDVHEELVLHKLVYELARK